MIYFRILIMLLVMLIIPFMIGIAGKVIFRSNKLKTSLVRTYTDGFLMWLSIYQILEVPMVLFKASLNMLSTCWLIISAMLTVVSLIFGRKQYKVLFTQLKESFTTWSLYKVLAYVMMAVIFIIAVFFENRSVTDDAFYLGAATDAVSSGKLWGYETYTGREVVGWELKRYAFAGYPMFMATFSRLLSLNVSVVAHVGMCIWSVFMTCIAYYLLSAVMFKEKWQRWAVICIMCALMLAGNYNAESSATFYMTGAWLGKSWLPNVGIPLVLYYSVLSMSNEKSKLKLHNYAGLFFAVTGSVFFSSMAVMLMPMFVMLLSIYYSIINRSVRNILPSAASLASAIVVAVLFGIL